MESSNVSSFLYILTEDRRTVKFKLYRYANEDKPSAMECKGKIRGLHLSYAYCGEQNLGIRYLAKEFGATDRKMKIKKVPSSLEIVETKNVKALLAGLKHSNWKEAMESKAIEAGVVGYWDDASLCICASNEYSFIIDAIQELLKPNRAHFAFNNIQCGGANLLIVEEQIC